MIVANDSVTWDQLRARVDAATKAIPDGPRSQGKHTYALRQDAAEAVIYSLSDADVVAVSRSAPDAPLEPRAEDDFSPSPRWRLDGEFFCQNGIIRRLNRSGNEEALAEFLARRWEPYLGFGRSIEDELARESPARLNVLLMVFDRGDALTQQSVYDIVVAAEDNPDFSATNRSIGASEAESLWAREYVANYVRYAVKNAESLRFNPDRLPPSYFFGVRPLLVPR